MATKPKSVFKDIDLIKDLDEPRFNAVIDEVRTLRDIWQDMLISYEKEVDLYHEFDDSYEFFIDRLYHYQAVLARVFAQLVGLGKFNQLLYFEYRLATESILSITSYDLELNEFLGSLLDNFITHNVTLNDLIIKR